MSSQKTITHLDDNDSSLTANGTNNDMTRQAFGEMYIKTATQHINQAVSFMEHLMTNLPAAITDLSAASGQSLPTSEVTIRAQLADFQVLIRQFRAELAEARYYVDYSPDDRIDELFFTT